MEPLIRIAAGVVSAMETPPSAERSIEIDRR
jgi:hypothetical protein